MNLYAKVFRALPWAAAGVAQSFILASAASFGQQPAGGQIAASPPAAPSSWRQYATPEDAGWSADKLREARDLAEQANSAAIMAVYRGHVLVAWGEVSRPFEAYSVRKSLMSGLVGAFAGTGKIDLQKTLAELGIDDVPPLSEQEKSARVVDLITSRSGVYHPAAKEPADMKAERPPRGSRGPGEHFWYNNWDFNIIGVIFERQTGMKIADAFLSHIAGPIGMEDFRIEDAYEQLEPSNSIHPAYGIEISARDLARFGQLFLQQGQWAGKPIVPAEWVAESTKAHSTVPNGGYGYMWWVWPKGGFGADSKLAGLNAFDKFSATGTGGQFLLVVPKADFVFVHRADTRNGRHVRGPQVWKIAETIFSGRPDIESRIPDSPKLIALSPTAFADTLPAPPRRKAIPLEPAKLDAFVGEYVKEPRYRVTVFKYQGRLFATMHGEGEGELLAESETSFFVPNENVQVRFELDEKARAVRATVHFMGQVETLERK